MKIYIFGSCSGTEPIEGMHHTSLAFEINERVYWFDAGENCSYTAHLMGVDLLSVSDIFISHPHMDHVGGLGNLLWNIRKLSIVKKQLPKYGDVKVYIPDTDTFDGIMKILKNTKGNSKTDYDILAEKTTDSCLLKNKDIEVVAFHNNHLPYSEKGWQSFSFCIKSQGKKIVYSGDVKGLEDLSEFLCDGCDVLLMETGHHKAEDICQQIKDKYKIDSLYFLHHGRGIINDFEGTLNRCKKIIPSVNLCYDGDVISI